MLSPAKRSGRPPTAWGVGALGLMLATSSAVPALGEQADVTILEPIQIAESENLAFGFIVPPTTGQQFYKIDEFDNSTAITGGGTGGAFLSGHHRGRYQISGTDGAVYDLQLTSGGACSNANLALTSVASFGTGILDDVDVYIGGTLRVNAAVPSGPHTCPYTLTATYN